MERGRASPPWKTWAKRSSAKAETTERLQPRMSSGNRMAAGICGHRRTAECGEVHAREWPGRAEDRDCHLQTADDAQPHPGNCDQAARTDRSYRHAGSA